MRIVGQSAVVAAVGAAALALLLNHAPQRILASSQGDENKIRDEEFMCVGRPLDVVIVGSSLSAVLRPLPETWWNLAQVGGGPLTGLELVRRARSRPRIVVVETNVFGFAGRDLKKDLVDEVTFPGIVRWRCDHRILQHRYRPVDVLVSFLAALRRAGRTFEPDPSAEVSDVDSGETSQQRKDRLDGVRIQLEAQAAPPVSSVIDGQANAARDACRELAQTGTECRFVELPEDVAVAASPFAVAARARLRQILPTSEFSWVPTIAPTSVLTSDGAHLTPASAARVTRQLRDWIDTRH